MSDEIVEPVAVYNSAFGEYPMEFFPAELVDRLVAGTSITVTEPCPTCGRGGGYDRVLSADAVNAMTVMEQLCYEDWRSKQK